MLLIRGTQGRQQRAFIVPATELGATCDALLAGRVELDWQRAAAQQPMEQADPARSIEVVRV